MIRNLDTDALVLGNEDEFWNELNASKHRCLERIRKIPGIILNLPHSCWTFLKYAIIAFTHLFLRHLIAFIVFYVSVLILILLIIFLRGYDRIIAAIYCSSVPFLSLITVIFKRGFIIITYKTRKEQAELQKLIKDYEHQNLPDADKRGYGTKYNRQPLQGFEETVMEPRPGGIANPAMGCPHCCRINDSPGPSSAPQCNCLTKTSYNSDDSDKPSRGLIVAHLHPEAIDFFGPPVQVFGAGALEVVDDLDECECDKTNK